MSQIQVDVVVALPFVGSLYALDCNDDIVNLLKPQRLHQKTHCINRGKV